MATFKISDTTRLLLKNFSAISKSILLAEGRTQKTIAAGKAVLAIAELPEAWPKETGIFDLDAFLGTLSLFKQPGIDFKDDAMVIASGNSRVRYRYSDPSTINTVPNKTLKTENPAVTFTLSEDALKQMNDTCRTLHLGAATISVAAGVVTLRAADAKNPASHAFEYEVPTEQMSFDDSSFAATITFKQEHLAMLLAGDYNVSLASDWRYGYFVHASEPVKYFIVGQA